MKKFACFPCEKPDALKKKSTTAIFDDEAPITQGDIDAGELVLRRRTAGRVVQPKKRVTLYLDAIIGERFKRLAAGLRCLAFGLSRPVEYSRPARFS